MTTPTAGKCPLGGIGLHGADVNYPGDITVISGPAAFIERPAMYLSDDLRRTPWKGHPNPLAGHCYVASEALYHLLGDDWKPEHVNHEGASHWYLRHRETGEILDVTAGQFDTPVPYDLGRGRGFLTREPSKRASILMSIINPGARF